ncbi:hypothetical protein PMAYCL1PPCAC_07202, partial [Pristionchus mayeri]
SGSISRSKPFKGASSSTHITFTPETLLFAAADYRQSKDVEVHNTGQSTIMFKMKSTSAEYYRIRPVFFILKPKEKRSVKVTFKGLPSDRAVCQRDRVTAVMAYAMSASNDVKMLWEKHRQIAHQPYSSSRKYIKIDFDDERRMSMARGVTSSAPKTNISLLTSAYPNPPDVPPSLPRPSGKVANSGGRDGSITHPNSTKKEQAIRPPAVHPNDLRPVAPPPPERLEPSLRTSIPLPPSRRLPPPPPPEESKEEEYAPPPPIKSKNLPVKRETPPPPVEEEEAPPPPVKSKTISVKTPLSRRLAPPPLVEESKEDPEDPPTPSMQKKSSMGGKTPPPRIPPTLSPSQQNSTIEDETSNLDDVPSLPKMDIPSLNPSGRSITDEESSHQQSIVYIVYPAEEEKSKEETGDEEE